MRQLNNYSNTNGLTKSPTASLGSQGEVAQLDDTGRGMSGNIRHPEGCLWKNNNNKTWNPKVWLQSRSTPQYVLSNTSLVVHLFSKRAPRVCTAKRLPARCMLAEQMYC